MFKHKKIVRKTLSKHITKSIKFTDTKPISSPLKTTFNLKDILIHKPIFPMSSQEDEY
jgi:hypothetical protein